jgi:ABC-type enterobactin transport system permease subunit
MKKENFKTSELIILGIVVLLIFLSEYYYLVQKNVDKAIFIGLWPPTILGLLNYLNLKTKK